MIPMRPMLVALVVLGVCIALPVVVAWPAGEPPLEIVSGEPDASPAYTQFSHHLKMNIIAWWQRDGQHKMPPTQQWRIGISQVGPGVAVWVQKHTPSTVWPGASWREWGPRRDVFSVYPLPGDFVEPSAAIAAAAVIEFLQGQAPGAAAGGEQKR